MIKEYMTYGCITQKLDTKVEEIAQKMKEYNIGFVPITEENKIIGVITDRDIVVGAIANKDDKIEPYIQRNIYTIEENSSLREALEEMKKHKVKRLLVTKENKAIGILSLSDLLQDNPEGLLETIQTIFTIEDNKREQVTEIDAFYL